MSGRGIFSPKDVSVVIPSIGKRSSELEKVVLHLREFGFEDINIVNEQQMMGRYNASVRAKNDVIYTQDDDCIVDNLEILIRAYNPDKIVCNAKRERLAWYENLCGNRVALVGYGSIFHKDLVHNMNRYFEKFPDDDFAHREADRIFSWLNDKEFIIADNYIRDFPSAMEGMSNKSGHFESLYKIIDRLRTL